MFRFFVVFTFIFYASLIIEVFFYREHIYDVRIDYGESSKFFFYSCYLSVYSYINIGILVFCKDITGLFTFIISRIELLVTKVILHIIIDRDYYTILSISIDFFIYFYIYYKWDNIKTLIFQEYNHRIGSDTTIRKIFVQRSAYCSFQNFTYVNYLLVILLRNQYEFADILSNVLLFLSPLPVFFSYIVRRFETEKEDEDAKFYAFISYLLTICLLISSFVIEKANKSFLGKYYLTYIMSIDIAHFVLLAIFCVLDYQFFGRGLKAFYEKRRIAKKIY